MKKCKQYKKKGSSFWNFLNISFINHKIKNIEGNNSIHVCLSLIIDERSWIQYSSLLKSSLSSTVYWIQPIIITTFCISCLLWAALHWRQLDAKSDHKDEAVDTMGVRERELWNRGRGGNFKYRRGQGCRAQLWQRRRRQTACASASEGCGQH